MKQSLEKIDFASFSFSPELSQAIEDVGFESPTKIQREAIPAIMSGKDVLARADTGSGKTAAFILPLLDNLTHQNLYGQEGRQLFNPSERANHNSIQVLILVPTRELTIQIAEVIQRFVKNIKPELTCLSVYGGVKINPQMMALRSGKDILIATPGRLLDLLDQNAVRFNRIKALVIDEVDRLMKGDFEEEIKRITELMPNKRQNLMFTATFPDSIRSIVRDIMREPKIIDIDEVEVFSAIEQHVVTVNHNKKNDLLAHLLNENDWQQILIFCSAKRTCDNLVEKLAKRDIASVAMHGNQMQSDRMLALKNFKSGNTRILIATDVASRGLDIEFLPCVINYDLPRSPNDYVHRIGRTARAGQSGQAITLIAHHEYQHFSVIETRNGFELPREQIEGFEPDDIAPPMPRKNSGLKKDNTRKKKLSKRQKAKLNGVVKRHVRSKPKADMAADSRVSIEKPTEHAGDNPSVNAGIWDKSKK